MYAISFEDFVVPSRRHPDLMMYLRRGEVNHLRGLAHHVALLPLGTLIMLRLEAAFFTVVVLGLLQKHGGAIVKLARDNWGVDMSNRLRKDYPAGQGDQHHYFAFLQTARNFVPKRNGQRFNCKIKFWIVSRANCSISSVQCCNFKSLATMILEIFFQNFLKLAISSIGLSACLSQRQVFFRITPMNSRF